MNYNVRHDPTTKEDVLPGDPGCECWLYSNGRIVTGVYVGPNRVCSDFVDVNRKIGRKKRIVIVPKSSISFFKELLQAR